MKANVNDVKNMLATDCGSTTSKARFFKKIGDQFRYVTSGEAPTTVEAPYEDVTLGVRNAIREVEELTGHKLLSDKGVIMPTLEKDVGVDIYVTTSSAGGGLQMMVAGVVKMMTAESAERAALGAGAIVMDTLATDDGVPVHKRIQKIRHTRPDMILLAGGTDGGTVDHVVEMAELISHANPKHRLGAMYELPIIFAGNREARGKIKDILGEKYALKICNNLRPVLEIEDVSEARDAVHLLFMEHVMSHAPGYGNLMKWTTVPIMPTPAGEGMMFRTMAETYNQNIIGVGLGGATTNVYSVFEGKFVRTVSANLGMSYSICNVLKAAGINNIMRWIPFKIDEFDVRNRLRNKMIRPTTIPQTLDALLIEHAVARESLRLAFQHHRYLARPLRGVRIERDIGAIFDQEIVETYIDMLNVRWLAGTGGLLSHAPRRAQSALMLIDGFQPEGVTNIAQDSVFMMPHLGVLSTVNRKAAMEIFEKDCLVRIGTCIAPKGELHEGKSEEIVTVNVNMPDGQVVKETMMSGTIKSIPLKEGEKAKVEIRPHRGFDVGAGPGHHLTITVDGGVVGIIVDARGRPLSLPEDDEKRREKLLEWFEALDAYPKKVFEMSKR